MLPERWPGEWFAGLYFEVDRGCGVDASVRLPELGVQRAVDVIDLLRVGMGRVLLGKKPILIIRDAAPEFGCGEELFHFGGVVSGAGVVEKSRMVGS